MQYSPVMSCRFCGPHQPNDGSTTDSRVRFRSPLDFWIKWILLRGTQDNRHACSVDLVARPRGTRLDREPTLQHSQIWTLYVYMLLDGKERPLGSSVLQRSVVADASGAGVLSSESSWQGVRCCRVQVGGRGEEYLVSPQNGVLLVEQQTWGAANCSEALRIPERRVHEEHCGCAPTLFNDQCASSKPIEMGVYEG